MATQTISRLKLSGEPLNVTVVASENWSGVTSIDFGGADVLFSGQTSTVHPFSGNTSISSITNCNLTNSNCKAIFLGCSALTEFSCGLGTTTDMQSAFTQCSSLEIVDLEIPNLTVNSAYIFKDCSSLKSSTLTFPKLVRFGDGIFQNCENLETVSVEASRFSGNSPSQIFPATPLFNGTMSSFRYAEWILPKRFSGLTQSSFSIPSTAPLTAYRYVDDLGGGLIKLVFTDTPRT